MIGKPREPLTEREAEAGRRDPEFARNVKELRRIWTAPTGFRAITAVNNTLIGLYYIGTAFLFFLLAGVLALVMRTQLARPDGAIVGAETYNQLFTMHGTVMMFLFAVPAVEAMGVYLLPNMLGARDLPFPRLSAYAFWAYFFGGLAFFTTIFFQVAPNTGWFMYPPLSSLGFSPGINADFWLLGIGFIEISAIAGAIEIVVGIMKTRAPGMTLDKLPIYAWAMLVLAGLIVFAFPAVILSTLLLELERAFDWPFFDPARGGHPLLWQHLFWFFGHPEVYIIFLPAAGMVSMIVPTMAQVPLVAHRLVVVALLATGFFSFGVWAHHMFTTGIPQVSLSYFSAASMAVAVPSGIQVFAWIATLAAGKVRMTVATLFVLGFLFIFTLGGLTGVMVGMVPFDWQVHDTYFVVAHFHYVLIGGMVFPLFAAFYYWAPFASRTALSERLGRWVFGLMFAGMNLAFFPMHISGLMGMPRRVFTYPAGLGWDPWNLASTAGAYLFAAGVLLFLVDLVRNFRPSEDNAGNIWNAGTLEWLPGERHGNHSIPRVTSTYPIWQQPGLVREVEEGRHFLPRSATGRRETLVTSPFSATPQYVLRLPGPSWFPVLGAAFTAAFFLLLTVKWVWVASACGVLAIVMILVWMWSSDPGEDHEPVDIGDGVVLPVTAEGPTSHAWWGVAVLLAVAGMLYGCLVFAHFFLWTVSPAQWPAATALPELRSPVVSAGLYVASSLLIMAADRGIGRGRNALAGLLVLVAVPLLLSAVALDGWSHFDAGLRPQASGYGATVFTMVALQGFYAFTLTVMAMFTLARAIAARLDPRRRASFDSMRMIWHFVVIQGLAGLAIVTGFPRLLGALS